MLQDVDLTPLNTFGLSAKTRFYYPVTREADLVEFLMDQGATQWPIRVLGGGSNVLLTDDFDGVVFHMGIQGMEVADTRQDHVLLRVGAGVEWQELVTHTLAHNWGGLENLSLIPGRVGAAPIQNIGAYGTEFKDVCESVEAIHIQTGQLRVFSAAHCAFGYRDSFFKREGKGKYVITHVALRLRLHPEVNLSYQALRQAVDAAGLVSPTIQEVGALVSEVRRSKLPDPRVIGNAGSFFKNPVLAPYLEAGLREEYPGMPRFLQEDGSIKVPAAWLIEQSGWKGFRKGDAGVHDKQALVLVNHGKAKGGEIVALSQEIQASVKAKFGVNLEPEVNFW